MYGRSLIVRLLVFFCVSVKRDVVCLCVFFCLCVKRKGRIDFMLINAYIQLVLYLFNSEIINEK